MVRIDYIKNMEYDPKSIERGKKVLQGFIKDFYKSLSPADKLAFFGVTGEAQASSK